MNQKNNYNEKELEKSGNGTLLGSDTGKLPLPPMLMVSRINEIFSTGGKYNKGRVKAELDINEDYWLVGYGMDDKGLLRGMNSIGYIEQIKML